METATSAPFSEAPGSEPRTLAALLLESIALRHQIAVLERSRTRRPCFRLWDRLFWILFSHWWPQWRDSLIIVKPETGSCAGAVRAGQRFGDIEHGVAGAGAPEDFQRSPTSDHKNGP